MQDILLLFSIVLLLTFVIAIVYVKDIFIKIIISGFISFFASIVYVIINALDVAFTEIAIGAGIATVLFLITLKLTNQYNYYNYSNISSNNYTFKLSSKIILFGSFAVVGLGLLLSMLNIPQFNSPYNPSHNYVYNAYTTESYNIYKVPNIVTMVLGSFRGFDTMGEVIVVAIAALGVLTILKNKSFKTEPTPEPVIRYYKDFNYVQTSAILTLMPIVLLFAIYVQLHGDYGPGGGFQAGVIMATPYILFIVLKASNHYAMLTIKHQVYLLAFGALIYVGTGIATMLMGHTFLDYIVFGNNPQHSYHYGLLSIEAGVGITVFSAMLIITSKFYQQLQNK